MFSSFANKYNRYSDGLCYKIYYPTEDHVISCSDEDNILTTGSKSLRSPPSTSTIVKVQHQPRF